MSGGRPPGGGASRGGSPGILPSRPWRVISLNTHSSFLKPVADYSLLILRFFNLNKRNIKKIVNRKYTLKRISRISSRTGTSNGLACLVTFTYHLSLRRLSRKEVFQPHLPVRLPCYDLAPVTSFTLGRSLTVTNFRYPRLPWLDGRCVQGPGTYSPRRG